MDVPDEVHHLVSHDVDSVQQVLGRLLLPPHHQVLVAPVQLQAEHGQLELESEVKDERILGDSVKTEDDVVWPGCLICETQTRDTNLPLRYMVQEEGEVPGEWVS